MQTLGGSVLSLCNRISSTLMAGDVGKTRGAYTVYTQDRTWKHSIPVCTVWPFVMNVCWNVYLYIVVE